MLIFLRKDKDETGQSPVLSPKTFVAPLVKPFFDMNVKPTTQ